MTRVAVKRKRRYAKKEEEVQNINNTRQRKNREMINFFLKLS